MNSIFCRVGSKRYSAKDIIKYFPQHDKYVEPFVGSGAVFFRKEKIKNEVINDLDKMLITAYKLLKSVTQSQFEEFKKLDTLKKKQAFINSNPTTTAGKLYKFIIQSCNTFSNSGKGKIYYNHSHFKKIKNIEEYKKRLRGTKILNQDYKRILKSHDSPSTLFYLDPPYEKSKGLYEDYSIDYEEMERVIRSLKGFVAISLNDSPKIRRIFKDYNIVKIDEIAGSRRIGKNFTSRIDILIMNYKLKK